MTTYFFDSSALTKRYLETGTNWIRQVSLRSSGNLIIVAQITRTETLSAVYRQRREGAISPRTAQAIRLLIARHRTREYRIVVLSNAILRLADDMLDKHPLRAYDSIQLTSAIEANRQLISTGQPRLVFVCADARLLTAAAAEGLATVNPNTI